MKAGYTHLVFIIDRSGSMQGVWPDVVGGYQQFIETQRKESGTATITTAVFDNEYEVVEDFTDIQRASPQLKTHPLGSTALLDALGKTINSVGARLASLSEDERPEKVLVIIQTDGQENASKEWRADKVKALIEEQESKYNWQFTFLGADLSSVAAAQSFGFKASNAAYYSQSNTKGAMDGVSAKFSSMRACAVADLESASAWTDEEKERLAKDA